MKPKANGSQEITKIRVEIETKKTTENINKTKSCFFEKTKKMDKYLARLRRKEDSNKIKNERGHIYQYHRNTVAHDRLL